MIYRTDNRALLRWLELVVAVLPATIIMPIYYLGFLLHIAFGFFGWERVGRGDLLFACISVMIVTLWCLLLFGPGVIMRVRYARWFALASIIFGMLAAGELTVRLINRGFMQGFEASSVLVGGYLVYLLAVSAHQAYTFVNISRYSRA